MLRQPVLIKLSSKNNVKLIQPENEKVKKAQNLKSGRQSADNLIFVMKKSNKVTFNKINVYFWW